MGIDPQQKDRWLREFWLNGFVILRDFLPVGWVEAAHEQLLPLARGELEKAHAGLERSERGPNRLAFDLSRYTKLLGGPLSEECYAANPVVEELVDEILGGPKHRERHWMQVECVWRGSVHMDWHSDQVPEDTPDPHAQSHPVRVTYNIPLVDFTWSNGALEILPGTHLLPRSFLSTSLADIPHIYPVRLDLRRGDALLRDGNGMHRGTPNLTDHPRPMLDRTYRWKPA